MMLFFWGGLVVLGVLALRAWQSRSPRAESQSGLDLLKARYARGEITKAEYEEVRRDLER